MRISIAVDDQVIPFVIDTGKDQLNLSDLETILEEIRPGTMARIKYLLIKEFFVGKG